MSWINTGLDSLLENRVCLQSGETNVISLSGTLPFLVAIVPRKRNSIFTNDIFPDVTTDTQIQGDQIRDRLPHWRSFNNASFSIDIFRRIKAVEYRMFLDLATQIGGQWLAQKRISVVCLYKRPNTRYRPVVNVSVELTRLPNNSALQFVQPDGTLDNALNGSNRPQTNNQGIAEFTIAHPTQAVPANQRTVTIRVSAELPRLGTDGMSTSTSTVTIREQLDIILVRNDTVTNVAGIYDDPINPNSALEGWFHQPTAPDARNNGIRNLQEAINEVVSRHRGINNYQFVPLTGVFDDDTRRALRQYLSNFNTINAGYPYNLTAIGPDNNFLTYVQEDYAPFNPTTNANRGGIVDRRLLIGDRRENNHDRIDGLWEIYEGVVEVLKDQVREYGQSYLDCDTFWLHRSIHGPFQAATDHVFACHNNGIVLHIGPNVAFPPLMSGGNPVAINDGDHLLVVFQVPNWVLIHHPTGHGWVPENQGSVVRNDAGRFRVPNNPGVQIQNHGNHGIVGVGYNRRHTRNGVAYTYGGKQTPDQWRDSLTTNPHANPDQIVNFSEYAATGHRFGETKAEYDAGNMSHCEAGCDCSGFVQNCITHACFPGTNIRIVPNNVTPAGPAWRSSGQFIGNNRLARPVPRPLNDADRHWMRGGDLIQRPGHIVMVAEDLPTMLGDTTDFMIMQESGSSRATDTTQFRRKSTRNPFSWWRHSHLGFNFGKLYIWI